MDEGQNGTAWQHRNEADRLSSLLARGTISSASSPEVEQGGMSSTDEPVPLVRPLADAEPYPVDGLGPQLQAVAKALNEVVQSPLAMCANSVLATVTLAAQGQINVELPIGAGSLRPVSGYYVTIGRSGERKSACDEQIAKGVKTREAELRVRHEAEMKEWRNAHDLWEAARKVIVAGKTEDKSAQLRALGEEPARPLMPILVMEEPTIEGLAKLLTTGQPSVGVFSTEGGQFIGGHAMTDEAKLRSAAGLSRLWDGEPWKRVRAQDGASTIADKRLSMHLMVQPDAAARFIDDPVLRDQGILSRLLITFPTTTMGTRLHRDPSREVLNEISRFNACMSHALSLPYPLRENSRNDLAPHWPEKHISISDIGRLGPNSVRVAQRARELVLLEDHHWLRKAPGPDRRRRAEGHRR
jgi:hypothetical protein